MPPSLANYRYAVDAEDRLAWVAPLWLAFAQENGAEDLTEDAVLGRSLWDFVSGEATRLFYRELHDRIRHSKETVVVPFRCDSPSMQRSMRMTIRHDEGNHLVYESKIFRAEPQTRLRIIDPHEPRSRAFLTVCSCCRRALLETVGWLELFDIAVRLKLYRAETIPQLHYTICPDCRKFSRH